MISAPYARSSSPNATGSGSRSPSNAPIQIGPGIRHTRLGQIEQVACPYDDDQKAIRLDRSILPSFRALRVQGDDLRFPHFGCN